MCLNKELSDGKSAGNLILQVIKYYVNLAALSMIQSEANFHWNNMMRWIEHALKSKMINSVQCKKTYSALSNIESKKANPFNWVCVDFPLNLLQKQLEDTKLKISTSTLKMFV